MTPPTPSAANGHFPGGSDWHEVLMVGRKGVLPNLANAIAALRSAPEWAGVLAFNEHALTITTRRETPFGSVDEWTDLQTCLLEEWFQHQEMPISNADCNKAIEIVSRDQRYHPVKDYLNSLTWDGQPRLDGWLSRYLGAEPTRLNEAVGSSWMTSAVARAEQPGAQVDHTLILEAPQGRGKSTAISVIGDPFYTDDIAELGTKDASLSTAGVWIVELSELDAMSRAEVSKVKAFLSRRVDRFRPPYGRRLVTVKRQCVFAGTVNQAEYLKDDTGGRRFWPVQCGTFDVEALRRDKDQLWAEALVRYRSGKPWWLDTAELISAAGEEQDARYMADPWEPKIAEWLIEIDRDEVTTADVLEEAIQKRTSDWTRADEIRVGVILRQVGWQPGRRARKPDGRRRPYRRPIPESCDSTVERLIEERVESQPHEKSAYIECKYLYEAYLDLRKEHLASSETQHQPLSPGEFDLHVRRFGYKKKKHYREPHPAVSVWEGIRFRNRSFQFAGT
jgi:predicted P-loop ATPase